MSNPDKRVRPEAWGEDVALRGPEAPKNDGKIKHLIEYLLTVYERFGNTVVTCDLQWGATALHKLNEERQRIEELEGHVGQLQAALEGSRIRIDQLTAVPHATDKE